MDFLPFSELPSWSSLIEDVVNHAGIRCPSVRCCPRGGLSPFSGFVRVERGGEEGKGDAIGM